jgi:hypothetical protein
MDNIDFATSKPLWSRVILLAMLIIVGIAAVLRHFGVVHLENEHLAALGGEFFGVFLIMNSLHAVRVGYFPGGPGTSGMHRDAKPIQFWVAVLLFGVCIPGIVFFICTKSLINLLIG